MLLKSCCSKKNKKIKRWETFKSFLNARQDKQNFARKIAWVFQLPHVSTLREKHYFKSKYKL